MKVIIILSLYVSNIILTVNGFLQLDWNPKNPAFNEDFYEGLLDPELCQEQLAVVRSNTELAIKFLESGLRLPRGITEGNLIDLGNYFQCIGISKDAGESKIEGKYCSINIPANQNIQLPDLPSLPDIPDWFPDISDWTDFDPTKLRINEETLEILLKHRTIDVAINAGANVRNVKPSSISGTGLEDLDFTLAVCVPRTCTTEDWINGLIINASAVGFEYTENYCRTNDDKPWVPADYVALIIFSILGFLTLLSTCYDLWKTFLLKSDPKQINPLYRCFSVYTNTRRLTTFTKNPGTLECLDGIRALSMMWVIIGHTFSTLPDRSNLIESVRWTLSIDSTWVTAAPISVDTFFMLSGLLLVYTTANKLTGVKLIRNLHVFYLNRLFRMFPLLAAAILIQASFLYRLSDGPMYELAAAETDKCRTYWWSTLLYIQNFANALDMCLSHTWYLAVDIQMYILSPIIMFWVLGRRRLTAWIALTVALLSFLLSSTIYNFIYEFPGAIITATRSDEYADYMMYYYLNTLTRASPFLVGMLFGYFLHLWRRERIILSKFTVLLLWICAIILMGLGIFSGHPMKSFDWDNQIVDSLINSFSRPIWAIGVGFVIVACVHGYGGPLNWFFSLQFWKLPSRLSYGMYLFHFQIMFVTAGSAVAPVHFTPLRTMYRFAAEQVIAIVVSFIMTVFIDSPFSTIFKLILGEGIKRPREEARTENEINTGIKLPREEATKENEINEIRLPFESNEKNIEFYEKL